MAKMTFSGFRQGLTDGWLLLKKFVVFSRNKWSLVSFL